MCFSCEHGLCLLLSIKVLTYLLKKYLWCGYLVWAVPIESGNEREKGDTKDHPLSQWFMNFSEADELLKLAAARQQVIMNFLLSSLS